MIFYLFLFIIFLFIVFYFSLRNFFKSNKNKKKFFDANSFISFNKKNLNNWMNLTKKERYNLSKQDSIQYFNKRKVLLEEIRKEYKRISKKNSGNT